jgi:hypothetical protein
VHDSLGPRTQVREPVVNPLAVPPSINQPHPAQISKMATDLWLGHLQGFHKEAHAYFSIANQVEDTQARLVSQRTEQLLGSELPSHMNGIPVTAIKAHLAINVKSVDQSLEFYKKMLGIEPSKIRKGKVFVVLQDNLPEKANATGQCCSPAKTANEACCTTEADEACCVAVS